MKLFQWLRKTKSELPSPEEVKSFFEELIENLAEMTDFFRTKEWSGLIEKSIDDNLVFKHLNKRHSSFRDCWYFLEEGPDAVRHGFDEFGGLSMDKALSIWPAKCVEILILSGMNPDDAMKLMQRFQPSLTT
jgi:hypothetical protein